MGIQEEKHALAEQIGDFTEAHGVEETGKLLSRFLLGLAHSANAKEIEFKDDIGRVLIEARSIPKKVKH